LDAQSSLQIGRVRIFRRVPLKLYIGPFLFPLQRNFLEQPPGNRQTDVEANDYHITSNPHFEEHPENSNDEQTEDNEISNLRHLREDVTSRKLDIPRDCITLTRVRLGRGQFGEVQQVLVRKPDEPEILCAAKMARGMDSTNSKSTQI
jgi:hypothetical protein